MLITFLDCFPRNLLQETKHAREAVNVTRDFIQNASAAQHGDHTFPDRLFSLSTSLGWKMRNWPAENPTAAVLDVLDSCGRGDEASAFLSQINEIFDPLDEGDRAVLVSAVLGRAGASIGAPAAAKYWHLLHRLLRGTGGRTSPQSPLPLNSISEIAESVKTQLPQTVSIETYKHIASCARLLTTEHMSSLRQEDFENIVVALHHSSVLDPDLVLPDGWIEGDETLLSAHPSTIYTLITEMTHVLLVRHRKRFKGRHFILIGLLQSLLRCLFVARPTAAGPTVPAFALEQPAWLTTDPTRNPLEVRHAESFNRLVTTFCDPSLSSVQKPRKGAAGSRDLTDATKTARSYAGQHAGYLLIALCSYQLDGLFAEEGMREALRPGVFAMLDAMGSEVQESFYNKDMGAAVRTLFKTWWDEWRGERRKRVG